MTPMQPQYRARAEAVERRVAELERLWDEHFNGCDFPRVQAERDRWELEAGGWANEANGLRGELTALRAAITALADEWAAELPGRVAIDRDGTCDGCAEGRHLVASYPEPGNEPWLCAECDDDMWKHVIDLRAILGTPA